MIDQERSAIGEDEIRPYCFDREGNNISIKKWGEFYENDAYRRLGIFELDNFTISTIWGGISHDGQGIFETIVFIPNDVKEEEEDPFFERNECLWEEYHSTELQALNYHQAMCINIKEICLSTACPSERKSLFLSVCEVLEGYPHLLKPDTYHRLEDGA